MAGTPGKMRKAKLAGSIYFIILGIVNIIAMYLYDKLGWKDFLLLGFLCTPLIVNKKIYYLIFGGLFTILFAYFLYYVFNTQTLYVRGQYDYQNARFNATQAFTMGYIFTIVSVVFSVLLLRVGLSSPKNKAIT